jgi:hypothetical protein
LAKSAAKLRGDKVGLAVLTHDFLHASYSIGALKRAIHGIDEMRVERRDIIVNVDQHGGCQALDIDDVQTASSCLL